MTVPPDVLFTAYAFLATGGTQSRTTPDRLADTVNVKDFGAVGNGVTDDGAAIIAAIAYAYSVPLPGINIKGGTVYFPAGTYFIDSSHFPISLTSSDGIGTLCIRGAGRNATVIVGNYSTGVADASNHYNAMFLKVFGGNLQSISDLTIWNQSTSPSATCIITNGLQTGQLFENIHFISPRGFIAEQECYGEAFRNCIFTCGSPLLVNRADNATATPFAGTVGLIHGQGTVENCRFEGFALGLGLANGASGATSGSVAFEITGNYFYRCSVGITGASTIALDTMNGASIAGNQFERCTRALYLNSIVNSSVISNRVGGTRNNLGGPTGPSPIFGMVLTGGTVTVTTSAAHNISGNQVIALVSINPATFIPPNAIWADGLGSGLVNATVVNSTSFSYPHSGSASGFVSGSWNYPMQYACTVVSSQQVLYGANVLDAPVSNYSFDASGLGGGGNEINNMIYSTQLPYGWNPPPFYTGVEGVGIPRMGWEFVMCDTPSVTNPNLFIQCRDLSAQFEGQTRYAIDVFNSKTFADTVVSGDGFGSNVYKVRYNGTNWLRVG